MAWMQGQSLPNVSSPSRWRCTTRTTANTTSSIRDDYFQFHGGMVASIRALTGVQPKAYFGDSSRPDTAQVRDLKEEALRVYPFPRDQSEVD